MSLLQHLTRVPYFRGLWARFPVGPLNLRVQWGIFHEYGPYMYGVYHAARLASALGIRRITAIELGVAGGKGLLALERIAEEVEGFTRVGVDVVGFDSGQGMPEPVDYRDLPHVWTTGFFQMDEDLLRRRLTRADLIIGEVGDTVPRWLRSDVSPVGFVAFDLDYYSSTTRAMRLFEGRWEKYLPRVHCYFDDISGPDFACMNEYVGELRAIREFNELHDSRKICRIENLQATRQCPERWNVKMYAFHYFDHPLYATNVMPLGLGRSQMPLELDRATRLDRPRGLARPTRPTVPVHANWGRRESDREQPQPSPVDVLAASLPGRRPQRPAPPAEVHGHAQGDDDEAESGVPLLRRLQQ